MSVITRRQIAKLLQEIASNHYQIHTFGWGDVPELLGRQGTIYPFMMVTPESPVMGEGEVTHRFRISIADRLQKGIENIEDVDSDMYQLLRDIITQIDNVAYQDMRVDLPVTIEPFRAEDAQDVYGFSGVIDIIVDEDYDQCAIPSDDVPFDPVPPPSCLPATYRVEYASGTLIEEGTIDSGDSKTIIVPDCEDANWTLVDANGIVIDTGSIAAGGSATITAPNGVVTIQDSNGSTLYVVDVASNGSEVQAVGDSTATVRNSNGVVVDNASILAEGSADLDAPDASVTVNGVAFKDVASGESGNIPVKKSSGSDLIGSKDGQFWRVGDSAITVRNSNNDVVDSGDVKATEAGNFVAPDGTVNVNKSDGTLIDSVDVASNDTEGYNVADSTVTNDATSPTYTANVKATEPLVLPRTDIEVNGVNEGDVKSVDTVEIELVDDNDDPVTPTSVDVTGQVVKVEVASAGPTPPPTGDHLVRFFDIDGTILKEEFVDNGNDATAPSDPDFDPTYLTFAEWNQPFTNVQHDLDVGAIYDTVDNKTYIFIRVTDVTGLQPTLRFNKSTTDLMTIDWGDSTSDTTSSSGDVTITKTAAYSSVGDYLIEVDCAGIYRNVQDVNFVNNSIYENSLIGIYLGNTFRVDRGTFRNCFNLSIVSINKDYKDASVDATRSRTMFLSCRVLRHINFPSNNFNALERQVMQGMINLKTVSIPQSITIFDTSCFENTEKLEVINIQSHIDLGLFCFVNSGVRKFKLNIKDIPSNLFRNSAIEDIEVANDTESIGTNSFESCLGLTKIEFPDTLNNIISRRNFRFTNTIIEYVFNSVTPPTLADTSTFEGINDACKIYVPDASVAAYKAATNWSVYEDYIYPLSTKP